MKDLETLRKEIDEIDDELLITLNKRYDICKQIGEYKKVNGIKEVTDPLREKKILERLKQYEKYKGIVENVWPSIISYSKELQKK